MDEDNVQTASPARTAEAAEDSFLEGWDDAEAPEVELEDEAAPEPTAEAPDTASDAPETPAEEETPATEPAPQEAPQTPPEQPKTWTLNHQGQPISVNEQDLAMLAQRGLDSVRLQQELDETRPMMELLADFAKQAGVTPKEYVSLLRMQALQARGMTQDEARRAVDLEDREASVKAQEAREQAQREQAERVRAEQTALEERRRAEVREFLAVFPDALQNGPLPPAVWEGVNQGLSLTASYARYANAQAQEAARQAEAVQRQNDANAVRSTGSMRSAGNAHKPKDPFLEGWDED